MNKIRLRKNTNRVKNVLMITIILVVMMTILLLNTIGSLASNNLLNICRNIINTINTNTVNNNIKIDLLKQYNINDLITVNYDSDRKISSVDYNLDKAYEILIAIKKEIISSISQNLDNIYNYDYEVRNNVVMLKMPFYNYTNNPLIANLGPKIWVSLSMIQLIDGSVKTKIKTYGINSLLIELYINFTITSTIVVPQEKENDNVNSYEILISSKVIQGEIPSLYNGLLETNSEIIDVG
jgi:sporulation protein YunB